MRDHSKPANASEWTGSVHRAAVRSKVQLRRQYFRRYRMVATREREKNYELCDLAGGENYLRAIGPELQRNVLRSGIK